MTPNRKQHLVLKLINNSLIDMPAPTNISAWWNFGSLLGMCLLIQLLTGVLLAVHYTADVHLAFTSVTHIMRDVKYGWLIRNMHANGATLFFITIFLHIGRGLYYGSYLYKKTWYTGITLLLMTMATAFMGYVLPWGQMSFWGATVITNLLSAAPYVGPTMVEWLWGGFAVDNPTLTRFFTFHFLLPFLILALTMLHLLFLHETGSSNPLGVSTTMEKVPFHPYFTYKDFLGLSIMIFVLFLLTLFFPCLLSDPENYSPANPLITPPHIKPEWYFLFAYAILRSIPNKLGGVVALMMSILMLLTLPTLHSSKFRGMTFRPLAQMMFWLWVANTLLLTWVGAQPVEEPYTTLAQLAAICYFMLLPLMPITSMMENHLARL